MGEISHLHARALDDAAIALDQRIDLVGERLDLPRIVALDPFRLAAADILQRTARPVERLQTEKNGKAVDDEPAEAEKRESGIETGGEEADLLLHNLEIAGHAKTRGPVAAVEYDLGFSDQDPVPHRIDHRIEALVVLVERHLLEARHGEFGHAERGRGERGSGKVAERLDQPVPAGFRLRKAQVAEFGTARQAVAVADRDGIDDIVELCAQEIVEAAFHALSVEGRDHQRDGDQRNR